MTIFFLAPFLFAEEGFHIREEKTSFGLVEEDATSGIVDKRTFSGLAEEKTSYDLAEEPPWIFGKTECERSAVRTCRKASSELKDE